MKKKPGMTMTLLFIGFLPLLLSGVILCVVTAFSQTNTMEEDTYQKLRVAADDLRKYYEWDIINAGEPTYEHDYIDSLKAEDIELTLFMGDTRFITSVKKDDGNRNEGTKMDAAIWEKVKGGQDVNAKGVNVGGHDFYVYYMPVRDGNNQIVGASWAGMPQTDVSGHRAFVLNIGTMLFMSYFERRRK